MQPLCAVCTKKVDEIQQDRRVALPDTCLIIILAKLISFSLITISTNRTYIEHAISELNKGSPLDRNIQVCYVMKHKVDQLLQLVFTQPCFQTLDGQDLTLLIGNKAIFSKEIVHLILGCRSKGRCKAASLASTAC